MPYFVYLLRSTNHKGASYIGFSTDPRHRLRQHNGEVKGGAKHTSKYSPWTHVCVVSGFLNKTMALMFEWHWQHPTRSLVLKQAAKGVKHHGRGPNGKLLLLNALLGDKLWSQCELTVNFLEKEGLSLYEKMREKRTLASSIKMTLVEPGDVEAMAKAAATYIDAVNIATSTADSAGKGVMCGLCNKGAKAAVDMYFWCCIQCGTSQHILCSAAAATATSRQQQQQQQQQLGGSSSSSTSGNVCLPDAYTCCECHVEISRVGAARMTFSPHFLLVDKSDTATTRRLSGQMVGDDDEEEEDDDGGDEGGGGGGGKARGGGVRKPRQKQKHPRDVDIDDDEEEDEAEEEDGISVMEEGGDDDNDSFSFTSGYLDDTNPWLQCDANGDDDKYRDNDDASTGTAREDEDEDGEGNGSAKEDEDSRQSSRQSFVYGSDGDNYLAAGAHEEDKNSSTGGGGGYNYPPGTGSSTGGGGAVYDLTQY
jgi:predicted GIY-YIG superfamily endonuclease